MPRRYLNNRYHPKGTTLTCLRCNVSFSGGARCGLRLTAMYCSRKCFQDTYANVGGRRIDKNGYVVVRLPKRSDGKVEWQREHRLIAEHVLGRKLKANEEVHHIDMDKTNNANSNLMICTAEYHHGLHRRMERAWVKEHLKVAK